MTSKSAAIDAVASECLGLRVKKLDRLVNRIYDQAFAPYQITLAQFNLLTAIHQMKEAKPNELGEFLVLEKSSLSRNLERLVAGGLVTSTSGPSGRIQSVRISSDGVERIKRAIPAWRKAQASFLRLVGADLSKKLKDLVDRPEFGA